MKRHTFKRDQIVSIRGAGVSKQDQEFVERFAAKCMRELSKKDHELPALRHRMEVKTKARRNVSRGGADGITIDVTSALDPRGYLHKQFQEYASIRNEAVFATIKGNPRLQLQAIIAHEVAHHVQYCYGVYTSRGRQFRKPHGTGWRQLYAVLRRTLINPHMEAS